MMSGLFSGGLEVTAVHNHLNEMSPHVMYMHYEGHGDAAQLARALRQALSASGTPFGGPATTPAAGAPRSTRNRSSRCLVARAATWHRRVPGDGATRGGHHGERHALAARHGSRDGAEFPGHADGKAAITGDFVLIDKEVNPVARTLRQHGIDVTAIHNHGLLDVPRLFYMHFWGVDLSAKLAQGLKAALDQTNSQR